ncbi:hypothetical protein BGZ47_009883 [Haplosporangium gracile]|nr:hypothetical protein BGZ47_009883 [Haplosporangium gracile]
MVPTLLLNSKPTFSVSPLQHSTNALITCNHPVASTGQRTVLETLLAFYWDKWYRRKQWDAAKIQRSSLDQAVSAVLRMAERTGAKLDAKDNSARDNKGEAMKSLARGSSNGTDLRLERVVICIGLAYFNSRTGLPSKHMQLCEKSAPTWCHHCRLQ